MFNSRKKTMHTFRIHNSYIIYNILYYISIFLKIYRYLINLKKKIKQLELI